MFPFSLDCTTIDSLIPYYQALYQDLRTTGSHSRLPEPFGPKLKICFAARQLQVEP